MATLYWRGTAPAVAQVGTIQVTAYDAATTYSITVGGVVISTIAAGSVNATATALALAWNTSTHPYCTAVTAVANTDTVSLTGDEEGVPYTVVASKSGGTGTIGAYTNTVACSGPNHWDTAANWSTGAVPVDSDDVILKDNAVNICWGLAQSSVDLTTLIIDKSYTGKIGLNRTVFATSSDGETTVTTALEYRDTYLAIAAVSATIGENQSPSNPAGCPRLLLDLGSATACTLRIRGTAASPSESGRPAIRLKANKNDHKIYIEDAPGGVGFAVDTPGETTTVGEINISDESTSSRVFIGRGVTVTTYVQNGGNNVLDAAATITTVTVYGGVLTINGDYTITTLNQWAGTIYDAHIKTGAAAITTLNIKGGTIDASVSQEPKTYTTVNIEPGGSLKANGAVLTITTLNDFAGLYTLSMA